MKITKEQLERIIKEEFANVIKEMSDDEWMYRRFDDAPQHSDAATPGKTTRQSNVAAQEEPVSRGGHPADHPKADVYKQQMSDLDRYLGLEEDLEEEMTKEGLLDWAKAKAARRWDWWENETEMIKPHPDTPPEVLKEIPHWMDIMKEWGLWPCSKAKIRRWWQRVGKGGFASKHEPVPARHNCAAGIKLAKQSALEKAGASGAQQSRRIKSDRKLASDRRSQKIQKEKEEARSAGKAARRAKLGITKEQFKRIIKEELAIALLEREGRHHVDIEAMKKLYKKEWLYVSGAAQVGASDSDIENMALAHTFKEFNIDPKSDPELASTLAPILTKTMQEGQICELQNTV